MHEIKYDGYRMQARIDEPNIRLLTRKNLDWTKRFRTIAEALKELHIGSALLDGEILIEDANGVSSFDLVGDLNEHWLKSSASSLSARFRSAIMMVKRQEFVILGYIPPTELSRE